MVNAGSVNSVELIDIYVIRTWASLTLTYNTFTDYLYLALDSIMLWQFSSVNTCDIHALRIQFKVGINSGDLELIGILKQQDRILRDPAGRTTAGQTLT